MTRFRTDVTLTACLLKTTKRRAYEPFGHQFGVQSCNFSVQSKFQHLWPMGILRSFRISSVRDLRFGSNFAYQRWQIRCLEFHVFESYKCGILVNFSYNCILCGRYSHCCSGACRNVLGLRFYKGGSLWNVVFMRSLRVCVC